MLESGDTLPGVCRRKQSVACTMRAGKMVPDSFWFCVVFVKRSPKKLFEVLK